MSDDSKWLGLGWCPLLGTFELGLQEMIPRRKIWCWNWSRDASHNLGAHPDCSGLSTWVLEPCLPGIDSIPDLVGLCNASTRKSLSFLQPQFPPSVKWMPALQHCGERQNTYPFLINKNLCTMSCPYHAPGIVPGVLAEICSTRICAHFTDERMEAWRCHMWLGQGGTNWTGLPPDASFSLQASVTSLETFLLLGSLSCDRFPPVLTPSFVSSQAGTISLRH